MRNRKLVIGAALACALAFAAMAPAAGQDTEADPNAASWVSGNIGFAPSCEQPDITELDGVKQARGYLCTPQEWMSDDPRLGGVGTVAWNTDVHTVEGQAYSVISFLYDVAGEDGGWTCRDDSALELGSDMFTTPVQDTGRLDCTGYGANDGLSAILVTDFRAAPFTVEGLIFPGTVPPAPELGEGDADEELPDVATVIDVAEVEERVRDLTIASPAVGTKRVRLILPAGFDDDPDRTWPVLYLLHGQGGSHLDWTTDTSIARTLAEELEALLVMPDAGAGYYSDWWNDGDGGQPMWETFHIGELLPILETDWRAGDQRAIAGISMGGFGAMSYAARHPDIFGAAASFSGVLDPYGSDWGYDPALWGDKAEQAEIWQAHDPVSLAPALTDTALYVWWGDGTEEAGGPVVDGLEAYLAPHSAAFVERLGALGIEATVESGPGTHDWTSWDEAVLRALPVLRSALEGSD